MIEVVRFQRFVPDFERDGPLGAAESETVDVASLEQRRDAVGEALRQQHRRARRIRVHGGAGAEDGHGQRRASEDRCRRSEGRENDRLSRANPGRVGLHRGDAVERHPRHWSGQPESEVVPLAGSVDRLLREHRPTGEEDGGSIDQVRLDRRRHLAGHRRQGVLHPDAPDDARHCQNRDPEQQPGEAGDTRKVHRRPLDRRSALEGAAGRVMLARIPRERKPAALGETALGQRAPLSLMRETRDPRPRSTAGSRRARW